MYELLTTKEIQKDLAKKIKTKRLVLNYTQEDFAIKSGITLSTYRSFENSGKGSFENFIKIIYALGRINELDKFLEIPSISPMDIIKNKKLKIEQKQRVRKNKQTVASEIKVYKNGESIIDKIKEYNAKNK